MCVTLPIYVTKHRTFCLDFFFYLFVGTILRSSVTALSSVSSYLGVKHKKGLAPAFLQHPTVLLEVTGMGVGSKMGWDALRSQSSFH